MFKAFCTSVCRGPTVWMHRHASLVFVDTVENLNGLTSVSLSSFEIITSTFSFFFFFQWFQSGFIQKRYKRGWYPKQVYVTLNIKMYVFYQCVYIWVLTPQSVNFEANHINNALRVLKYLLTVSQRSPCPSYSTLPHSLKTLLWGTIDLVQHTVVSMKNCLKWREAAISWPW